MAAVAVELVDAFVREGAGGNPAGVVLDAAGLAERDLQALARLVGAPETAFVLSSGRADVRLRFFTPRQEVELCGHATVAAFSRLGWAPGAYRQETRVGLLAVEVLADGRVFMDQPLPRFAGEIPKEAAAAALGLQAARVVSPPALVSTGLLDLFVELDSRAALLSLKPDFGRLSRFSASLGAGGLHVYTLEGADPACAARCRNFSPRLGIDEEAATGTSSGALACLLHRRGRLEEDGLDDLRFTQGEALGRPSEIAVRLSLRGGRLERVRVGGRAQARGRRLFDVAKDRSRG